MAVRRSRSAGPAGRLVVHDHATLALHRAGAPGEVYMGGRYETAAGDVLLVPASAPHAVGGEGAEWTCVSLCLSCLQSDAGGPLTELFDEVRRGGCALRRLAPPEHRAFEVRVDAIERELAEGAPGRDLALGAHLTLLAVAALRATPSTTAPRRSSPFVAEALAFVDRNATGGISLSDVARHVARSPAYVTSRVKAETGDTVVAWITKARMSAGRQLLLHTDETIERVAERCGFASPSHFHRAFKRAHGTTPSDWRRTHRGAA